MIRKHSFITAIKEIITFSDEMDFTKIGLVGDQHSGKSTLARAISHLAHKYSVKLLLTIKLSTQEELLNFEESIDGLCKPANFILIFDDVYFLSECLQKSDLELSNNAITRIRFLGRRTRSKNYYYFELSHH